MKTSDDFERFHTDYYICTGRIVNNDDPESLALYLQYIQLRTLLDIRTIILEQNNKMDEIIKVLKPDSDSK